MVTLERLGGLSSEVFDMLRDNDLSLQDSLTVLGFLITPMLKLADDLHAGTAEQWISMLRKALAEAGFRETVH